jgi:hypothetical protein
LDLYQIHVNRFREIVLTPLCINTFIVIFSQVISMSIYLEKFTLLHGILPHEWTLMGHSILSWRSLLANYKPSVHFDPILWATGAYPSLAIGILRWVNFVLRVVTLLILVQFNVLTVLNFWNLNSFILLPVADSHHKWFLLHLSCFSLDHAWF